MIRTGTVATTNGAKYVRQLVKHWSHKQDTQMESDQRGIVRFPDAVVTMDASDDGLSIAISSDVAETALRLRDIVARHIDRFAFREAPLNYHWD